MQEIDDDTGKCSRGFGLIMTYIPLRSGHLHCTLCFWPFTRHRTYNNFFSKNVPGISKLSAEKSVRFYQVSLYSLNAIVICLVLPFRISHTYLSLVPMKFGPMIDGAEGDFPEVHYVQRERR